MTDLKAVAWTERDTLEQLAKNPSHYGVLRGEPDDMFCVPVYAAPPAPEVKAEAGEPDDLDTRMAAAGMIPLSEMLKGTPVDKWRVHAGIRSLDDFERWLGRKREEFARMSAEQELRKDPADDLYEWVLAHSSVFSEVLLNYRAAKNATPPSPRYAEGYAAGIEAAAELEAIAGLINYENIHYIARVGGLSVWCERMQDRLRALKQGGEGNV